MHCYFHWKSCWKNWKEKIDCFSKRQNYNDVSIINTLEWSYPLKFYQLLYKTVSPDLQTLLLKSFLSFLPHLPEKDYHFLGGWFLQFVSFNFFTNIYRYPLYICCHLFEFERDQRRCNKVPLGLKLMPLISNI